MELHVAKKQTVTKNTKSRWCVDDCVDVLMTVLMCWCVDVLMTVLMCWWLCWCVDVLMCWCIDVSVDVSVEACQWLCWWSRWWSRWCAWRVDDAIVLVTIVFIDGLVCWDCVDVLIPAKHLLTKLQTPDPSNMATIAEQNAPALFKTISPAWSPHGSSEFPHGVTRTTKRTRPIVGDKRHHWLTEGSLTFPWSWRLVKSYKRFTPKTCVKQWIGSRYCPKAQKDHFLDREGKTAWLAIDAWESLHRLFLSSILVLKF
jgi:hypothetical protein